MSERRAALTALTRKYGETIDEVLDWARRGAERLLLLDDTEGHIAELTGRLEELRAELAQRREDIDATLAELDVVEARCREDLRRLGEA